MRKREWIRCTDAEQMLREVMGLPTESNKRRLRLFALTAGRRLWARLRNEALRLAVDAAWRQAEDAVAVEEIEQQLQALDQFYLEACSTDSWVIARLVRVLMGLFRWPESAALELIIPLSLVGGGDPVPLFNPSETAACCGLLREIFGDRGNPVIIDRDLLAWNEGTVVKLAKTIYEERRFEDMPILADALEEAGCTNTDILTHCRQPAEHVRGCWVVDLVLERK